VTLYARARDLAAAATHRLWRGMVWAGAVGPQDRLARRYHAFGDGTLIAFPPGDIFGQEHIALGPGSLIGAQVSMSVGMAPGQPLPPGAVSPVLRIGARCSIGRGSHLVAHRSVVIGDDVMTGPSCYVTDQNHVYSDPGTPVGQQWPAEDPVEIGPGSWLGAGAVILPGTRLGRNTVVGAGAVVRGEFPDHAVLAGVPAKLIRRYDPATGWQPELRELHIDPPEGWSVAR
jgi:carbonic anhydrase/acetyltransferase-like protein (isoleucine patch superfamily)